MIVRKIPIAIPDIGALEASYVADAVESGWVSSLGPYIRRFEEGFAAFCETSEAVAVTNGTVALELGLRALGVGPGDEVIIPGLTFAAVPAAVLHVGATPVIVDIDNYYWGIDPELVEEALTPRTRAVIAVHLYGHPANLAALSSVCQMNGLYLVEDCAEAHGASADGRRVGSVGAIGTFSFYGNKIVTTGEGGMITTSDAQLAERLRFLRDHAMDPKRRYYHTEVGYNARLTNLQAALGCAQLERVNSLLAARENILGWYREELQGLVGISLNPTEKWAEPVNWLVCVRLADAIASQRDRLLEDLGACGIDTRPFFVPLSDLPPYRSVRQLSREGARISNTQMVAAAGFNLPTSTTLTREDVAHVCGHVRSALARVMPGPGEHVD